MMGSFSLDFSLGIYIIATASNLIAMASTLVSICIHHPGFEVTVGLLASLGATEPGAVLRWAKSLEPHQAGVNEFSSQMRPV